MTTAADLDPAYITFDLGGHEYTATVHAIEDLERWLAANHHRIKDYSVDTFGDHNPRDVGDTVRSFLDVDDDDVPDGVWGAWRYFDEYERPGPWTKTHYFPILSETADIYSVREADAALCGAAPDRSRPSENEGEYDRGGLPNRCKMCLRALGE